MRFPARLDFHEVTPDRWPDFERLFEARGGPKYCWCMVFRAMDRKSTPSNAGRKVAMRGRIAAGTPTGILGYLDGDPVAWCSVAPKATFERLGDIDDDRGIRRRSGRSPASSCLVLTEVRGSPSA